MNEFPCSISVTIAPDRVYASLHTRPEGLTSTEVAERQDHIGKNSFEVIDRWKLLRLLGRQFTNFFAILLIISAVICFIAQRINPGKAWASSAGP